MVALIHVFGWGWSIPQVAEEQKEAQIFMQQVLAEEADVKRWVGT